MKKLWVVSLLAIGAADAATTGRVLAEQAANPGRGREAMVAEFELADAVAYPRSWVSEESRYEVLLVPAGVDLSALKTSLEPGDWTSSFLRGDKVRALKISIDTDGDAVEMYLYADGKMELGASGTMGQVYAPRIENGRLRGHYLHLSDLFGSPIFIDVQIDAELWQMPKGEALPAGGGDAGKAYLDLVSAIQSGNEKRIRAAHPPAQAESAEDFTEMLPFMQSMMPKKPKVQSGKMFGEMAVLSVSDGADAKKKIKVEMAKADGRWVMKSSSSGQDAELPTPPPFAETKPDLCPAVLKGGLICGDTGFKDQTYKMQHVLAVQSSDEFHMALLSEVALDAKHASALWDSDKPLEPLYKNKPMRSLLLNFPGASGKLGNDVGYVIDAAGKFTEEFMLRAEGLRIGNKLFAEMKQETFNSETGESTLVGMLRFEADIMDARQKP